MLAVYSSPADYLEKRVGATFCKISSPSAKLQQTWRVDTLVWVWGKAPAYLDRFCGVKLLSLTVLK